MELLSFAGFTSSSNHDVLPPRLVGIEHDTSCGMVRVTWSDAHIAEFDPTWLRHNAPSARLASGQSLTDPVDLPNDLRVENLAINALNQAVIMWSDGFGPVALNAAWLRQHAEPEVIVDPAELWHEPLGDRLARADYGTWLEDDAVLLDWLSGYQRFGVALLHGVPTQEQSIELVAERIGIILETNYGRVFSVKTKAEPENLADSSLGLSLHTDNPYREPPPGAQMLHCLRADNEGGESLFADGFAAAKRLAQQNPDAYAILTHTPIRFRYQTDDTQLEAYAPMIELDSTGMVRALRFNNRSMVPAAQPAREVAAFYAAYRALHRQLHAAESVLRIKLGAGDLVLMNNRRLLHGRSAFTRGGERHLRGCYLQADSIMSRLAVLKRERLSQQNPGDEAMA